MLSLAAGPFPLTLAGVPVNFGQAGVMWHDELGLVGNIGVVGCIAQIDGVAHQRNGVGIQDGYITQNLVTHGLGVRDIGSFKFYDVLNMHVLYADSTQSYIDHISVQSFTVLSDRHIWAYNGDIRVWTGSTTVVETVLDANPAHGLGRGFITKADVAESVYVGFEDGRIYLYNYVTKVVDPVIRYVDPCEFVFYSPALGVFIGVHKEGSPLATVIRVWANEVEPSAISAPVALDAVVRGVAARIQVQVTGDQGEPVAGIAVGWSSDVEEVAPTESLTDDDGYAETRARISPTSAETTIDVTAEVSF